MSTTKLLDAAGNGTVYPGSNPGSQEPELGSTYRVKVKFPWVSSPTVPIASVAP